MQCTNISKGRVVDNRSKSTLYHVQSSAWMHVKIKTILLFFCFHGHVRAHIWANVDRQSNYHIRWNKFLLLQNNLFCYRTIFNFFVARTIEKMFRSKNKLSKTRNSRGRLLLQHLMRDPEQRPHI